MAVRHGLAGKYGKSEAWKRSRRIIFVVIAIAGVACGAIGFVCGFTLHRYTPLIATVAVLGVTVSASLIWRILEPRVDEIAKSRIKFLRGGQAEALIAWLLEDLDDSWHIFNGIKLEKESDIDHVVVGPGGVFCISTKSQRGHFAGTAEGLLHNMQPCDFAQQVLWQTMNLKDRMSIAMGRDVPWIQPVLAVPFGFTEADACGGKVWLMHKENITERIAPEDGPMKLDKRQISRAVKVLEMIGSGAAEVYERRDRENGY